MMKRSKIAIQLKGVTKEYILHHEKPTFAENLMKQGTTEKFTALKSLDLTIFKGERIGIIGKNGSGKTTLLKIIAGITTPTLGEVKTWGKIVSLIDLEAGFHPDLTGEENIFLNGLVIGMSKEQIRKKFRTIVNFADIGNFIDAPLYSYSLGMKLRLGFAVAIHSNPEILILDEGILTGDKNFQQKVAITLKDFIYHKKTLIVASHWSSFLRANCEKIIWINNSLIDIGDHKLIDEYEKNTKT